MEDNKNKIESSTEVKESMFSNLANTIAEGHARLELLLLGICAKLKADVVTVSEGQNVNIIPVIHANTKSCGIEIETFDPDGNNPKRIIINLLGKGGIPQEASFNIKDFLAIGVFNAKEVVDYLNSTFYGSVFLLDVDEENNEN